MHTHIIAFLHAHFQVHVTMCCVISGEFSLRDWYELRLHARRKSAEHEPSNCACMHMCMLAHQAGCITCSNERTFLSGTVHDCMHAYMHMRHSYINRYMHVVGCIWQTTGMHATIYKWHPYEIYLPTRGSSSLFIRTYPTRTTLMFSRPQLTHSFVFLYTRSHQPTHLTYNITSARWFFTLSGIRKHGWIEKQN